MTFEVKRPGSFRRTLQNHGNNCYYTNESNYPDWKNLKKYAYRVWFRPRPIVLKNQKIRSYKRKKHCDLLLQMKQRSTNASPVNWITSEQKRRGNMKEPIKIHQPPSVHWLALLKRHTQHNYGNIVKDLESKFWLKFFYDNGGSAGKKSRNSRYFVQKNSGYSRFLGNFRP